MLSMESTEGLEVVDNSGLELAKPVAVYPDQAPQYYDTRPPTEANNTQTIWGLNVRTFWTLVAVAAGTIIVAAALGGGLGGGLSQKNQNSQQNQNLQQTSSVPPAASTSGSITTSSVLVSPSITADVGTANGQTVTLYRDCPSSNNTQYSVQYSNSTTYEFQKLCGMQAVLVGQHPNSVNQPTANLNDCINLCAEWNENNVTNANVADACSSVCWRYGFDNDDFPGQCFGFNGNNASYSSGYNLQPSTNCDSAIWINQS